jgi:hypothetical protein
MFSVKQPRQNVTFSEVWASNSVPIFKVGHLVISFGDTKSPAYSKNGDGDSYRNVAKSSHPEAAV